MDDIDTDPTVSKKMHEWYTRKPPKVSGICIIKPDKTF